MKMIVTVAVMMAAVSTSAFAAGGRAGRAGAGAGRGADRGAVVAKREAAQARRIEEGIKKGQLTPDEVTGLKKQESDIGALETSLKADGKVSKEDAKKLKEALNAASIQIWAQRHDTEGNQKPMSRLGKDIFAQDTLTAKVESGDLTKAGARQILGDFHKMVTIKRRLGADNVPDEQRAKLQEEYNTLLNLYFVVK